MTGVGAATALWAVLAWSAVVGVAGSGRVNAWGWWYDSGAAISYERRVNLVAQMLTNEPRPLLVALEVS
jgi:hypothetical protein